MTNYNELDLIDGDWEEKHIAEITDSGIYFDHNFMDGCTYISHEKIDELIEFRDEFLEEINEE